MTSRQTTEGWFVPLRQPAFIYSPMSDPVSIGIAYVATKPPFDPRRPLAGLALKLLAVSNAWRQP